MAHPQLGRQALDTIANNVKVAGSLERSPLIEGRTMTMILTPLHPKESRETKEANARELEKAAEAPPNATS
jgi:hypothetical protein